MTRMRRFGRAVAPATAALWALGASPAHAIPNYLTVQGLLTNEAGTAINGTYDIKFSLYTAQNGGTLLWDETETSIVVVDGIFDDVLGDVDPVADPLRTEYFRNNAEVWLQIELEAGPGVVANEAPLPRQPLTTTAFAFAAHHATTATTATSASTATSATTATTAATATVAQGLVCNPACVSLSELDFDPATQAELNNAVANLVSTTALNTALGGYVTSTSLTTTLGNYATTASLANYATLNSLSAYATTASVGTSITAALQPYSNTTAMNSAISTALQPYSNTAAMNTAISTALSDYVSTTALNTALSSALQPYATTTSVTSAIGSAIQGFATNASVTSAINTALANYSTTTAMNTAISSALSGYATSASVGTAIAAGLQNYSTTTAMNTAITNALSGYATTASVGTAITAALQNYATTASVGTAISSALSGYVSSSSLSAALVGYAQQEDLPTTIAGLTGGTVTGNVTATTAVEAPVVKQNGNTVCDESGNCGRTMDDFTCEAGQVLVKTADNWECQTADGGVPPAQCVGAGRVLQWDGTAWQCVNMYNSSISAGQANGFEARDEWGDAWDGMPRSPKTWAEANQTCLDEGGRLPTVTELWRNRSSWGSGNIGNPNDGYYHWTIAPSYRANYYLAVYLSNNSRTEAIATNRYAYRCIWKSEKPAGFSGNRCYGPPGAECAEKNSFYNMDKWSRAPQFYASAKKECDLENASVMSVQDYEEEIQRGTLIQTPGDENWPWWHWTTSSSYHDNGYGYISILRWTSPLEAFWGATSSWANHAGEGSWYNFRCVGKKDPTMGKTIGTPACINNNCFTTPATGVRNKLTADNENRPATTWGAAFKACRALGAYLPTANEAMHLIKSGWGNGPYNGAASGYLWSGSPSTWSWLVFRWVGTGNILWYIHYHYSVPEMQTSTEALPTASFPYRCVWREAEHQAWTTCPATQVQMRNEADGTYSCVNKVNGNPNGQQNPSNFPPFVDDWGNAIDFQQRAAATFAVAKTTCESRGGRLPLATELFRLRYNQGVVPNELGQSGTATQDYLWTLNPSYRENYNIQVRLSDGVATDVASNGATTAPYRCIWPATRPEAFSGHACYGLPSDPCFEVARIRTDRYPRAKIPQASAQFECRYLGGRLATLRETAELRQAGLPNSVSGQWEWSPEWSYHNNGNTYIYMTSRGTNATVADWQSNVNLTEIDWSLYGSYYGFRCAFTDMME